ncbi:hypothetical protein [Geobacter sp.]|uniref:hypothetical protein n=1 Tax=Geobacter sp. TaxID=46610 RepID=UPI00260A3A37|nr:hypothetical protein [Geobacter sp.]
MKKLIVAAAACTLLAGVHGTGHAAGNGEGRGRGTEPPVAAQDRRPHIPKMLELMAPTLDTLAGRLEKDRSAATAAAVSRTLKEMAEEIREMYRLSMASSDVRREADDLYRRVAETGKKAGGAGEK